VIVSVGGSANSPAALQLRLQDREVARAVAAPGERAALRAAPQSKGWFAAKVVLDPDELRADDVWNLALRITDPSRRERGMVRGGSCAKLSACSRARAGWVRGTWWSSMIG
jgi:hypothetical protein